MYSCFWSFIYKKNTHCSLKAHIIERKDTYQIYMERQEMTSSSTKTDRKTVERNRRNQMRNLYSQLHSLIPHDQTSKEVVSQPDQLDEARDYIQKLQRKIEKMKEKKELLMGDLKIGKNMMSTNNKALEKGQGGIKSPKIEISNVGSALQVTLTSQQLDHHQSLFYESIRVLHEEGIEIVNANLTVVDDTVFQTIHSKVGELGDGFVARISRRLQKLVHELI